jgi:hypothetical protein
LSNDFYIIITPLGSKVASTQPFIDAVETVSLTKRAFFGYRRKALAKKRGNLEEFNITVKIL